MREVLDTTIVNYPEKSKKPENPIVLIRQDRI